MNENPGIPAIYDLKKKIVSITIENVEKIRRMNMFRKTQPGWTLASSMILVGLIISLILGLVSQVSAAAPNPTRKLNIVTSFYPMYAMTREVVGDLHEVRMINSGQGIHGFEPSAKDVAAIYDADIFIYHSVILESWTKNIARNLDGHKVQLLEAAKDLEMDRVTGMEDLEVIPGMDEASLNDPHTWMDPIEAGREVQLIADALSQIDPANEPTYQANAQQFIKRAEALVADYQPLFNALQQKTFVTQHTAFSYLAKRFGLKQLGISGISNDQEPTAQQLAEVKEFVETYQVKTIFVEPNDNDAAARMIASYTGAGVELLSPLEADPQNNQSFLDNLTTNIDHLYQTLKKEG